ncbi:MAG: type II toxin-antitoxin system RelE/ParE family toxin [Novosphingobium sp.]
MRLEIKHAARIDLRDIATYIARDNPGRSESFVEELIARIETVAARPSSFPARNEWGEGIRSALHGRYVIVFRVGDDLVEILRILHGARDINSLLEP